MIHNVYFFFRLKDTRDYDPDNLSPFVLILTSTTKQAIPSIVSPYLSSPSFVSGPIKGGRVT